MKKILLLIGFLFCVGVNAEGTSGLEASRAIRVHAPGTVFMQGEELRFSVNDGFPHPESWSLRDWRGQEIRRGKWPAKHSGTLVLKTLPNGYYLLAPESGKTPFRGVRSFAVVTDTATRRRNPASFFALDSAQSWLAVPNKKNRLHPQDGYEVVSELLRRAGAEIVRERLRWEECEPVPGKLEWGRYMLNAKLLSDRGVRISGLYHDAPPWTKQGAGYYPDDLIAVYRFANAAAKTFRGKMAVWEFWNEPDHGSVPAPPWDFASAYKAACLGFKDAIPGVPVMNGGFAVTMPHPHMDIVLKNAAEYIDIFNVHTYMPLRDFPGVITELRQLLARYGMEDCPLWFTENGTEAEGTAAINGEPAGIRVHSPEQEMILAEFLPKSMIYLQSLGVDRDFFFVLPPYNERRGTKDWGLLRRDYSVKPAYVTFATLTDRLSAAEYLGTIRAGKGIRGFLYLLPDGTQTLVYWSVSPLDTERHGADLKMSNRYERSFQLQTGNGNFRIFNIFGTPHEVRAKDGVLTLTADRLPKLLTGLSGMKPDVPFRRTEKAAVRPVGYSDKTIVYRVKLSNDFTISPAKNCVDPGKENAKFTLQIFNLSKTSKRGMVRFPGGRITKLPSLITLPPFSKTELPLSFTPELNRDYCGELRVEGVFNGRKTTPLVIPVVSRTKMLAEARRVPLVRAADPAAWRSNSSGRMEITADAEERAVCFSVRFPPGVDRWVYPEFVLHLPDESLKDVIGISFEVRVSSAAQLRQMLVMGVAGTEKEHGRTFLFPVLPPTEKWNERAFSLFDSNATPEKLRQLRIGLNTDADEIVYFLRNIQLLYRK